MSGNKISIPVRADVEKFGGNINFGLWQIQVKNLLIQSGLHKILKGREAYKRRDSQKSSMSDEDLDDLDERAASMIYMCLAKIVLANVLGKMTAKDFWRKLEELYQAKGVSNRVYLKEQFHTLRMNEGTKISDHLNVLNGIVSELEAIGVKIEDEDKALRFI
ncbi:hypothetical protein PanWU01x14_042160 [Parasponia andersonii]|uniref:Retrovirus-related Pol polyprotein from transposon TNT 1-94 n=1 Tax=Parasponia andersonii TaxID=3476 RepID=A0A2P5DQP2_PARAD|nr:hypothetical protein PanWU01x14_042160 [Parasponia andersonii]